VVAEERTRDEETGRVTARRTTSGGMDVPTWGIDGFGPSPRQPGNDSGRFENDWNAMRRSGPPNPRGGNGGGSRGQLHVQRPLQVRALAPTGTSPADVKRHNSAGLVTLDAPVISEGIYQPEGATEHLPILKTLHIYPFGVSRDRLAEAARQLRVPIIVSNNQHDADAVITVKNYYRRQPDRVQQAEEERKTVIILKNNTVAQMQHALARIFDIPVENPMDDDEDETGAPAEGKTGGQKNGTNGASKDDPTMKALLDTEDAIHQVLNKGLTTAELPPANAYIRRLQHQMATRYNLASRSRGKEPNRRVKIFRTRD
jgi:hypothetical protein